MSCRLHGHRLPPPPRSPQSLPPDRRSRTGMHVYLPVVSALPSIIRVSIDSSRFTDQLISFLTVIGMYLTRVISNQLLHLHGWMAPRGRQQRSAELLVGKPLQKALRRLLEVSLQHPMQVFCLTPFIVSLHVWYLTYIWIASSRFLSCVPGWAFKSSLPYIELKDSDLMNSASMQVQRQFYQVYMRAKNING